MQSPVYSVLNVLASLYNHGHRPDDSLIVANIKNQDGTMILCHMLGMYACSNADEHRSL